MRAVRPADKEARCRRTTSRSVITVLECLECGARDEAAEGWRAYLEPDGDGLLDLLRRVRPARVRRLRGGHERYGGGVLAEVAAAALICLDPGHGTAPEIGRQLEPIGPGSAQLKIKDPGGAAGEAPVALAIARRTRALLLARGYRVAMTRDGTGYRGGNRERARFCNARGAALMLRIHADGSSDPRVRGVSTLVPALRRGWTDDIYAASRRAGGSCSGSSSPRPERATSASSSAPT